MVVMKSCGLELIGTRPPSVTESRASSALGKHHGYHSISNSSNVDETLFKSHTPSKLEETVSFKPPWAYKKRDIWDVTNNELKSDKKGRPLLWSPDPHVSLDGSVTSSFARRKTTGSGPLSNNKLARSKHNPTFVDETLFGPRLKPPSFEAPWGDKEKRPRPHIFVPVDLYMGGTIQPEGSLKRDRKIYKTRSRPSSGRASRSGSATGERPIWKP
ncbi:RBPJ-interacting and tubulin-associated protein 1-like [Gigantopelta aegis]|uniref:RBPJ-interacting and tubulin-associated protein 1-like n=1 Tax=Gigantopelta aegis TaxID=1735272 RepID=UPI001B88D991|nr:RBPJ-interacting and tubulin-associated protein 1-like [Gigantopelta aegis]XP_041360684.1 RBPJ-interacting and tubulin-associated protein 1-like [Gigantopelta aegis]